MCSRIECGRRFPYPPHRFAPFHMHTKWENKKKTLSGVYGPLHNERCTKTDPSNFDFDVDFNAAPFKTSNLYNCMEQLLLHIAYACECSRAAFDAIECLHFMGFCVGVCVCAVSAVSAVDAPFVDLSYCCGPPRINSFIFYQIIADNVIDSMLSRIGSDMCVLGDGA